MRLQQCLHALPQGRVVARCAFQVGRAVGGGQAERLSENLQVPIWRIGLVHDRVMARTGAGLKETDKMVRVA